MKIIKHGKIKKTKPTRFKCVNCGCVFDINDKEFNKYVMYVGTYKYSYCPECGGQSNEIKHKFII